ncbi:maleylacetoacetate isomerase [Sphingomonas kyeonggiensis]|uniref:Maleylacetoacetate isomerase n=1 Tax=Sphingomonas kyeonggiensis TaxID=1268553 RepID=A0A7W7K0P4_9SPHN|nr:maleylacetoacetate isomerase [Sphingomonas kyeonggiensis]MBB4838240.1 maleylacetoacetate isomerase [Sphingomonas kyeonggiensis]
MILYDYFRSSASYRVRIALNLKGVAVERRDVMLLENQQRSPEHLARNPQGFVPALEADDGHVITQSLAILDWLDARYPEPRLIPADPDARAAALARALVIAADTHPLNNLRVMRRLKDMGVDEAGRNDWTRHWIAEGFTALEAMAGESPFLGGDAPGVADLFLVPQMYNARRFDTPLAAFPRLVAIDAACTALPAFAAAHPDAVAPK